MGSLQLDTNTVLYVASGVILAVGGLLGFLLSKIGSIGSSMLEKHMETVQQNTHAIIKLETQMEHLNKRLDTVAQLEKDVNSLGQRYRSIVQKMKGRTTDDNPG